MITSPIQKVKAFASGRPAVTAIAVIAILILTWTFFNSENKGRFETVRAQIGDIQEIVSVTGTVKAAGRVQLSFESTGRIASIPVSVGGRVLRGSTIASLVGADARANLEKALANVALEVVNLNELERGTRLEEIDVQRASVANASVLVNEAKKKLVDVNRDGFTKVDDAVRGKVDQFISNSTTGSPSLDFDISNPQLEINIESMRVALERDLDRWRLSLNSPIAENDLSIASAEARQNMNQVLLFLDNVAIAVNSVSSSGTLTQATLDSYRADVSTARTNVNTALSNLTAAEEKLSSAKTSLLLEESELALKNAGATGDEILAQEARLREARASESSARAELAKNYITSPFSGTVTRINAEIGEFVSQGEIVAEVISDSGFEIETNVPEVDVSKIKINDEAMVTLDAYGSSEVFNAVVSFIDPAETIVDGVSTYTTTLVFSAPDPRIRSGMTANIDIVTAERQGAVIVPSRAVINRDGKTIIQTIASDGSAKDREVEVGIRGFDGNIEIISGISEGETVITFIPAE